MLGGLKGYTSTHTYPFVCSQHVVTGYWDWTVFDPQAQKYLNWLRSSDSNMVTKFLSSLVKVLACHHFGANHCLNQWWYIVNWNLRNKLMWNYIANTNRVGFLLEETYFFRDTRKKVEETYFFQFCPDKTGRNWTKLWRMSEMLEKNNYHT